MLPNIAFDCDEVLVPTADAIRSYYLKYIDPTAEIPRHTFPSTWPVMNLKTTDDTDALLRFRRLLAGFMNHPASARIPPMPDADVTVYELARAGYPMIVVSSIGSGASIIRRRTEQIEYAIGKNIFSKIICIEPGESKEQALRENKIDILVDDGASNITDAIKNGRHGIWAKCPENKTIIDAARAITSGKIAPENLPAFRKFDLGLLADKAHIADDIKAVPGIVYGLGKIRGG